ncbi:MAG TPA: hypothetical protein DCZ94_07705 [Lentisphaeria bacterium]|nr:MAG: hypothetical protein A2X48_14385 [Lentisphaerae bacterium GWF2_49_21]HBC86822.1 hypothetical protein [Lentisphaeria bacterium]
MSPRHIFKIFNFSILIAFISACSTAEKKDQSAEKERKSVVQSIEELLVPTPPQKLDQKVSQEIPAYIKIIPGKDDKTTIIYRCRNMKSKAALDAIEGIVSTSGTVEESADQNMVIINDISAKTDELKEALMSMDVKIPQILVEAKVIEVYIDEGMERDVRVEYTKIDATKGLTSTYGYNLSAPTQNPLPTQGGGFDFYPYAKGVAGGNLKDLNVFMKWLVKARDAKILSSPNLIVDLGTTASMFTGEDVPIIQTQTNGGVVTTSTLFKRIGVRLNVTPVLINEDIVKLNINPEVSTIIRSEPFTQNEITVNNPVISIRNINTELVAGDNEIIMLGGLYSNTVFKSQRKTPFLSGMLGELFSAVDESDVKTQLVFLLKINILKKAGTPNGFVGQDLDRTANEAKRLGEIIRASEDIFPDKMKDKQKAWDEHAEEKDGKN